MHYFKIIVLLFMACLAFILALPAQTATDGSGLVAKIIAAKAGSTIAIPAGNYDMSEIDVPAGVSIKGAGYSLTTLFIKGQNGLYVKGGTKAIISDMTIQGADSAGVALEDSRDIIVARVRVKRCLTGFLLTGGRNLRLENCAAGENRTGVVMNNTLKSAVVNCTLASNSSLGLSMSGTIDSAAFNNLFALNAIGVYLAQNNTRLTLDYNLYWGALIGKGKDRPSCVQPTA